MKFLLFIFTSLLCITQNNDMLGSSSNKDTSNNTSNESISTEIDPDWNWSNEPYDANPEATRTIREIIEYEMFNDLEEQVQLSIMACKMRQLQNELDSLRKQVKKNSENPTNQPSESNKKQA